MNLPPIWKTNLTCIAEGDVGWQGIIKDFYEPFHANLDTKYNEIKKEDIMPEEKSDVKCDKCGAHMIIKTGRYGKFLACSAFPDCKNIKGMDGDGKERKNQRTSKNWKKNTKEPPATNAAATWRLKTAALAPFWLVLLIQNAKILNLLKKIKIVPELNAPNVIKAKLFKNEVSAASFMPATLTRIVKMPTGENPPVTNARTANL
jgi:hypothetical protein